MIIPIAGSFLEAAATTLDKYIIKFKGMTFKSYLFFGFLGIIIAMLPFIYFFWNLKPEAFLIKNLIILAIVVITALFANILVLYSLKKESLSVMEPIRMMQPLFTILIAFILSFFFIAYENEKNPLILFLAIVASIALVAGHVKKHHLSLDKYIISAIFGSLLFAIELVISKSILQYYNGLTFYFIRSIIILIISYLAFRPKLKIKSKPALLILLVSAMWIVYRVILYWGYQNLNIVMTTILLSVLPPIFIFIFAKIFLKEKITIRQIISAVIIVVCVVAAVLIKI